MKNEMAADLKPKEGILEVVSFLVSKVSIGRFLFHLTPEIIRNRGADAACEAEGETFGLCNALIKLN